jgi:hypothetical protein
MATGGEKPRQVFIVAAFMDRNSSVVTLTNNIVKRMFQSRRNLKLLLNM